jgi:hypothetical protein
MSSLTILFPSRVFVLSSSRCHQNRRDVISCNGLMTIWLWRTKSTWRGLISVVPWGRVRQVATSHIYCTLFQSFINLSFPFPKACQVLGFNHQRLSNSNEKEKELRWPKVGCTKSDANNCLFFLSWKRRACAGLFIGGTQQSYCNALNAANYLPRQ